MEDLWNTKLTNLAPTVDHLMHWHIMSGALNVLVATPLDHTRMEIKCKPQPPCRTNDYAYTRVEQGAQHFY